ncbi:hypothetical protein Cpir12675_002971 [Ceratocystis pirilliformis]|uniref:DnaJ homologue subfamily C member 28 conserved domain-containing protein n=1 Tax=Ceratocystis pirilliformis TaxID=259994 RepID=A0ABR3Z7C7_9PEZI
MLSHLRFHRRGVSNPTSPTLPTAPVPDGQPPSQRVHGLNIAHGHGHGHGQAQTQAQAQAQAQARSQPESRSQGNSPYLQSHAQFQPLPQSQTHSQSQSQSASRTSSPHRSKTKSLFLSPSSLSSGSAFDTAPFTLPSIPQDVASDIPSAISPRQSASAVSSPIPDDNSPSTRFIGGLALLKYQSRRQQTAASASASAGSGAPRLGVGSENTSPSYTPNNTNGNSFSAITTSSSTYFPPGPLSPAPLPPINTSLNINFSAGRYSLPAQPSPGYASPSSSILSPPYNDKSPSFVTPTDIKNHQEMQKHQQQQQQPQHGIPSAMLANNASIPMGPMTTISASGPSSAFEKQQVPPKKTKGITFLRPVSTLLLRRKGNNSVPDLIPLGRVAEEPAYDPRIKGTRVHDFSAPRSKRAPSSAIPPQTNSFHGHVNTSGGLHVYNLPKLSTSASTSTLVGPQPNSATSEAADPTAAVKDAASLPASLRSVPSTVSVGQPATGKSEDAFQETTTQEHTRTFSFKSRISRKISMSEISLHSSISRRMKSTSSRFSFDMIGAAKQEKIMEERHRQRQLERGEAPEEPAEVNAFVQGDDRFDDFDMDDFDYDNMMDDDGLEEEIPGLNLDYDEAEILEDEEHEDPFEYDEQYSGANNGYEAGNVSPVQEGLGHMTLADIEAADTLVASSAPTSSAVLDEVPDTATAISPVAHSLIDDNTASTNRDTTQDIVQDIAQDIPQETTKSTRFPLVSDPQCESRVVEQIIETPLPHSNRSAAATAKRDSQNFAAFIFQRSNPTSQLASPRSFGVQATPRDAEGRVIGFACSNETPPGTGKSFSGWGPCPGNIADNKTSTAVGALGSAADHPRESEEAQKSLDVMIARDVTPSGVYVRINSPLSSIGEAEPEAIPLEMQEQFQMRASANQRLGVLEGEENTFDANISNDLSGEFITDEFTTGNDASFDESIFDMDDTDQYGRPIPGAFAMAKQRLSESRDKLKRDSAALAPEPSLDVSNLQPEQSDSRPTLHPITIPSFYPRHHAECLQQISPENAATHDAIIAMGLSHMGLRNEIRGVGPETRPEDVMAYQAALAAAAQKAADAGKFQRHSWLSEVDDGNGQDRGQPIGQGNSAAATARAGAGDTNVEIDAADDLDLGGGFNMADYENDDMDDYFDLDQADDSKIIEEANASALANDYDGWYGQEFGFYSAPLNQAHQLNSAVKYEYSNGGFFGPAGMPTISRSDSGRVAVREPNLTPITERSEYSNRNSIMSLPGITVPTSAITSPGLSQLAMIADNEESMSMSTLLRLRSRAWGGGSQASSNHGSPRSERADGASSPLASFVGVSSGLNEHLHSMSAAGGRDMEPEKFESTNSLSGARTSIGVAPAVGGSGLRVLFSPVTSSGGEGAPDQTQTQVQGQTQTQTQTQTPIPTTAGFPPAREFPLASAASSAPPISLTLNTALSPGVTSNAVSENPLRHTEMLPLTRCALSLAQRPSPRLPSLTQSTSSNSQGPSEIEAPPFKNKESAATNHSGSSAAALVATSTTGPLVSEIPDTITEPENPNDDAPLSPLAQRLQDATEEALYTGGLAGRQSIVNAGFSPALRAKLLAKISHASPPSSGTTTAATSIPTAAGRGTRDTALSEPWDGSEKTPDAVLRMLDDAHKRLPVELRAPPPGASVVDLRPQRAMWASPGERIARARDAAADYAALEGRSASTHPAPGLAPFPILGTATTTATPATSGPDTEREERLRLFKERFEPGTRALPHSLPGLASLANERIEAAMARGAFSDIPRGPGVQRDERGGNNPFIDTTEYIMNNMLKRQDLAPPWIDKQQEITRATETFRNRIRTSWKIRLLSLIGSSSGRGASSLEERIARARANACAEVRWNPPPRGPTAGLGSVAAGATDDVVMKAGRGAGIPVEAGAVPDNNDSSPMVLSPPPLRDPNWEHNERKFLALSIAEVNALLRSYNLMAPDLAKKAYLSIDIELRLCYAEVAAQAEQALRTGETRPARVNGTGLGQILGRGAGWGFNLGADGGGPPERRVPDTPGSYGLRDMWRDLWGRKE